MPPLSRVQPSTVPRKTERNTQWHHLLFIAVTTVSASSVIADWNPTPETIENHPTWIYTPPSPNALSNGKHPLLIALHGCDQNHIQLKEFGNLKKTADIYGMVVAIPDVGSRFFGPRCFDYNMASDDKQHITELVKLTEELKSRASLNIDPDHVYVLGLSAGGAMTLALGCKAPNIFAGISAIAGPSVGSSQNIATTDGKAIPTQNTSTALNKCKSLAGSNQSHFDTQIANITYGAMDKNGPQTATGRPGQKELVSIKWSEDNIKVLQNIYGTDTLGAEETVQNGLGKLKEAKKDGDVRLSLLVVNDVGHAWPAGTRESSSSSQPGNWIAQSGLAYPEFAVGWLISHNQRAQVGRPEVTVTASGSATELSMTGTAKDPDGSIARIDTVLLKANTAGAFHQEGSHNGISVGSNGIYSDKYSSLPDGWYKAQVTATDNTANTATQLSIAAKVGNPPPYSMPRVHRQ